MSFICVDANDLRSDNIAVLAKKKGIQISTNGCLSPFTDESWEILAEVIRTTTSLEKLVFNYGDIMTTALQHDRVVDAIAKNLSIKTLDLWQKYVFIEEAKAVAAILKENSTIQIIGHRITSRWTLSSTSTSSDAARARARNNPR